MVHNGIEYGMMAALAEGLNVLHNADIGTRKQDSDAETAPLEHPEYYKYDIDTTSVSEVWRRGSVIGSWLLDLLAISLYESPDLDELLRPGLGLRRGALDVDRRDRGGRPSAGPHQRAVLAVLLPPARPVRRQGAVRYAQAVRRPRREARPGLTWNSAALTGGAG